MTVNEGALAEQFAGQELRASGLPFEDAPLFYWHREARNANAEVDYVIGVGGEVLPVEVKAAAGGALRSVFQFLSEKGLGAGYSVYLGAAGEDRCPCRAISRTVRLLSLPLYLAGQVRRLAAEWRDAPPSPTLS